MKPEGWQSRKLWLAFITMGLIYSAWLLCGRPQTLFGELCMALITAASIYKGSNAVDRWLDTKRPPAS